MSIASLCSIHTVDVYQEANGRGDFGGSKPTVTLLRSAVKCRIQPMSSFERSQMLQAGLERTHNVYFAQDPQVDEKHVLRFVDGAGTTRDFEVQGSINFDELQRLWRVECAEVEVRGTAASS